MVNLWGGEKILFSPQLNETRSPIMEKEKRAHRGHCINCICAPKTKCLQFENFLNIFIP